jgi:hypothetical protein
MVVHHHGLQPMTFSQLVFFTLKNKIGEKNNLNQLTRKMLFYKF